MTATHDPTAEDLAEGRGNYVGWLTPADELDDIELGERVTIWQTNWEFALLYTYEDDRIRAAVGCLVGQVSSETTHRGLPFPPEWWPPSAGDMPDFRKEMFDE